MPARLPILVAALALAIPAAAQVEVRPLEIPAGERASLPRLAPGADGRTYLSWVEPGREGRAVLAFSVLEGGRFAEARRIAEGSNWFVNWADYPSVAALADGTLAAHWLEKVGPGTYAYGVRATTSTDRGRTWREPFWLHDDGTETEHGFVSIRPWSEDRFAAVWLDGRRMAGGGGPMTLRAATFDAAGRLGDETVLDERTCECCDTSAVVLEDGGWLVVYRDRDEAEVRDVALVARRAGAWGRPAPIVADGWRLDGCPVQGPAIAAYGSRVAVAWFTGAGRPRVRAVLSTDGGRTFGEPVDLDGGAPIGRVDAAFLEDGRLAVVWLERAGAGAADVRIRLVSPDGAPADPVRVATVAAGRGSGVPQMERDGDDLIVAWTAPEPPTLRVARVSTR